MPRLALRNGNQIYVVEDGKLAFHNVKTIYTSPEIALLDMHDDRVHPDQQVVMSSVPGAFEGMEVEIRGAQQASNSDGIDVAETTEDTAVGDALGVTEELEQSDSTSEEGLDQAREQAEVDEPNTLDEAI